MHYFNGQGVFKNMKKAKSFYTKACQGGNMMSCSNLGLMYATGKGTEVNKTKAIKLLTKACKNVNKNSSIMGGESICSNLEFVKNNNIGTSYWLMKLTE